MKTSKCPVCGSDGEDLVFAFYCFNEKCQNFKKQKQEEYESEDYVTIKIDSSDDDGIESCFSYGFWPYGD